MKNKFHKSKENMLRHLEEGMKLCDRMYAEFQDKIKDPKKTEAYKLSEKAWSLIFIKKNYNPEKAIELMTKAAELDEEYLPQVQGVKNMIERKSKKRRVNLKKAINKIFLPKIEELDFYPFVYDHTVPNYLKKCKEWFRDVTFVRSKNNNKIHIYLSRTKFGNELGVVISKVFNKDNVVHLKHGANLEYLNQNELEKVLIKLLENIKNKLKEWDELES